MKNFDRTTHGFRAWFECFAGCGVCYALDEVVYQCERCGGLLEVRHDIQALHSLSPDAWKRLFDSRRGQHSGVWSKKEVVLPQLDADKTVSLGEGNSALVGAERLAEAIGVGEIYLKLCGASLTGSFKDLGMTVLVSMVNQIRSRVRAVVCASTGDTSAALAAYCAAAGIPAIVILPKNRVSVAQLIQALANGALTLSVDADFDGCMRIVQKITEDRSVYLANSMNSLRVEGQKTISFEVAEQLGWSVPDFVVVPGGNLGNVSAIGNGFLLMKEMGLVDRIPRLVCAQAERANPLYLSYRQGFESFHQITAGQTMATAIQIGNPVSFSKAVRVLRATNGIVEQASEAELANAAAFVDRFGFFSDPQTGVALAVVRKLSQSGMIPRDSRVVVISTAHGLKFVDFKLRCLKDDVPGLDKTAHNLPVEVPEDVHSVRAAIDARLPA